MTTKEQQTIDNLQKLIFELRSDTKNLTENLTEKLTNMVEAINKKVDEKREPLNLETEVIRTLQTTLQQAFQKVLTDSYNSPLKKYADNIVTKHQSAIESIFDKIVSEGIQTQEFKDSVKVTFLHKLSKTVVSGIDGSIDKTVNQMKQDPIFRSRLTLVVDGLVQEFIENK